MTAPNLTPDELDALALVRARARMDRADLAPIRQILARAGVPIAERVIPWRAAIELEVPR